MTLLWWDKWPLPGNIVIMNGACNKSCICYMFQNRYQFHSWSSTENPTHHYKNMIAVCTRQFSLDPKSQNISSIYKLDNWKCCKCDSSNQVTQWQSSSSMTMFYHTSKMHLLILCYQQLGMQCMLQSAFIEWLSGNSVQFRCDFMQSTHSLCG